MKSYKNLNKISFKLEKIKLTPDGAISYETSQTTKTNSILFSFHFFTIIKNPLNLISQNDKQHHKTRTFLSNSICKHQKH